MIIRPHIHFKELDEKNRSAILENIGTSVVFRVGALDADILIEDFFPKFIKADFK
jgi:hypothetical protein